MKEGVQDEKRENFYSQNAQRNCKRICKGKQWQQMHVPYASA